jgi:hypothetical protein
MTANMHIVDQKIAIRKILIEEVNVRARRSSRC